MPVVTPYATAWNGLGRGGEGGEEREGEGGEEER